MMKKLVPSGGWARKSTRAAAAIGLVLALLAGAPAQAQVVTGPVPSNGRVLPPPPPGTRRLIRIGPQALVEQDPRGHVRMAEEPTPRPSPAKGVAAMAAAAGAVGAAAFLMLEGDVGLSVDVGAQTSIR
jgi:hypothetical protein